MTDAESELVPGRSCDGCTMCCKLMEVEELKKPRGTWCVHCDKAKGCTIYGTRPHSCRNFYCGYRRLPNLDDRWNPAKAKLLVNEETESNRICIHVDPERPDAWRRDPFLKMFRFWAASTARNGGYVIVWWGHQAAIVMPDRVKELGHVRDDQVILQTVTDGRRDFIVIEPDDPRAFEPAGPG